MYFKELTASLSLALSSSSFFFFCPDRCNDAVSCDKCKWVSNPTECFHIEYFKIMMTLSLVENTCIVRAVTPQLARMPLKGHISCKSVWYVWRQRFRAPRSCSSTNTCWYLSLRNSNARSFTRAPNCFSIWNTDYACRCVGLLLEQVGVHRTAACNKGVQGIEELLAALRELCHDTGVPHRVPCLLRC